MSKQYLIFYTEYKLNNLIDIINQIFKTKNIISKTDFIECNKNIYIYCNEDNINDIVNDKINTSLEDNIFIKYKLIQILYIKTDYLDFFDIVNGSIKYLIKNSNEICYIPENININEITIDKEFIILKLNLDKFNQCKRDDLEIINNLILDYHIIYNKDRLDFNDEYIDIICLWTYIFCDKQINVIDKLNKYFDDLNITKDNYTISKDKKNCCYLLYDLNIKSNDFSLFSKNNLENNVKIYNIKDSYHLIIKRKCLKYINFEYGYIHDRSEDGFPYYYYKDNYILSKFDYNNCNTYGRDSLGDNILILNKKYKDDILLFDIIV